MTKFSEEKIAQTQRNNKVHELVISESIGARTISESIEHLEDAIKRLKAKYYADQKNFDDRCAVVNFVYDPTSHYSDNLFVDIIMHGTREHAISILKRQKDEETFHHNGRKIDKKTLYEMLKEDFNE